MFNVGRQLPFFEDYLQITDWYDVIYLLFYLFILTNYLLVYLLN